MVLLPVDRPHAFPSRSSRIIFSPKVSKENNAGHHPLPNIPKQKQMNWTEWCSGTQFVWCLWLHTYTHQSLTIGDICHRIHPANKHGPTKKHDPPSPCNFSWWCPAACSNAQRTGHRVVFKTLQFSSIFNVEELSGAHKKKDFKRDFNGCRIDSRRNSNLCLCRWGFLAFPNRNPLTPILKRYLKHKRNNIPPGK